MFWRRAVDPEFDARSVIPAITAIVAGLLNVRAEGDTRAVLGSKPADVHGATP
jgi:hypothetical protein